jgi:hypothetical protein
MVIVRTGKRAHRLTVMRAGRAGVSLVSGYFAYGELQLGGAVGEPLDLAVLLFSGESSKAAEDFAKADPYVRSGLVRRWRVRPWTTVVGEDAATPVR